MKESLLLQKTAGYNHVSESYTGTHVRYFSDAKNATVFLSHNHEDRDLVLRVKYLLESLDTTVYIDWLDTKMPEFTNPDTARELKKRIKECDKFILIATEAAIESKWCNWELGQGDSLKYQKEKIAILPIEPDSTSWKGKEYLNIYPEIVYEDGSKSYSNGSPIVQGYYYKHYDKESHVWKFRTLVSWLKG